MTETEFVREIKEGNQQAFRRLVELHKDKIFNTCYGFLHSREDAEDVSQEVFLEVYKSIHNFREKASLTTWLYRIAVNKSLNLCKKNKYKKWRDSLQSFLSGEKKDGAIADIAAEDPHTSLEQKERRRVLRHAIEGLAENQKIAFNLCKIEGLSYKEIAEVMGTTIPSVESLLNRAKKNLQKKLHYYYQNTKPQTRNAIR